MINRIDKVRDILLIKGLDAILICKPENIRYISGFTGTTGYVIITKTDAQFITDFRYLEQAQKECVGFSIIEISNREALIDLIKNLHPSSLGVEEEFFTYGDATALQLNIKSTSLVKLRGALTKIRSIKEEGELKLIEKAARIGDKAFEHILNFIKPGISEIDISIELDFYMRKSGSSGASFDFIVASGTRSSLPHGVASKKIIEKGDFVTLDFGCIYDGYCSDMTRTVVVGKANDRQREIYSLVLKAQETALQAVKPGISGIELDSIARGIISSEGYGNYFGHGLGHGAGLEIHELPNINSRGDVRMESGMVITIEPGIYIPGFGGVRIEDLVFVTEGGHNVVSKTSKELIEV